MIELLRTPTWLVGRMNDMPEDEKIEPPPIATLPEPPPPPPQIDRNDPDAVAIESAAVVMARIKAERMADKQQIERLQVALAETTLEREGDKRKIAVLEADLAEAHNNTQALEAQNQDYRQTFQLIQHRLDGHGIVRTEKNGKRNGNGNKKKSP